MSEENVARIRIGILFFCRKTTRTEPSKRISKTVIMFKDYLFFRTLTHFHHFIFIHKVQNEAKQTEFE